MLTLSFIKKVIIGTVAWLAAVAMLFAFMLIPVILVRIFFHIPFNSPGPDWEIGILITGGALGAGAARLTHHLILSKFAGANQSEIDASWYGKKKLSPMQYGLFVAVFGGAFWGYFMWLIFERHQVPSWHLIAAATAFGICSGLILAQQRRKELANREDSSGPYTRR